jgi:hypothetical protein
MAGTQAELSFQEFLAMLTRIALVVFADATNCRRFRLGRHSSAEEKIRVSDGAATL